MARLLHVSDTHLGYRQYHLDERLDDFAKAFSEVISAAIDNNVDAIVHSGDLFHTSRPGITPLQTVFTELQRLQNEDIPFLLIVGNHERTHNRNWVELLEEVGLATRLDHDGTQIADTTLYGQDFVPPGQRDRLEYEFDKPTTESAILVSHGLFTPFGHGDWDSREILSKSRVNFDLMLVGDDHVPHRAVISGGSESTESSDDTDQVDIGNPESRPSIEQEVPISYAGSTERTKADQRLPRSYSIVTVPSDGEINPEEHIDRRLLENTRRFVYADVEVRPGDGLDVVRDAVREQVDGTLDGAVLKVTIDAAEDADSGGEKTPTMDPDGDTEGAVHERIPEGPIVNLGNELGALITRVGDRRSLSQDEREHDPVEFADIDAAVEKRRQYMTVTKPADKLLEMALDLEQVPENTIADTAEETVEELLDELDVSAFHINEQSASGRETTASPDDDMDTSDGVTPDHAAELIDESAQ